MPATETEQAIASNGHGPAENVEPPEGVDLESLGDDPQDELFVLEGEKRVTLSQLISRSTPVEYEFKLGGKAVRGALGMSLVSFSEPDLTLVVPVRAGKVIVDPTYDADGAVKSVKVRVEVKPKRVYDSRSDAARQVLLGER